MTDTSTTASVAAPSLARNLWTAYGQKALTIGVTFAVTWLVSHKVLPSADQQQAVTLLVAVAGYGLSVLWTQFHEQRRAAASPAAPKAQA
jgi:hypothetical protein